MTTNERIDAINALARILNPNIGLLGKYIGEDTFVNRKVKDSVENKLVELIKEL